MLPVRVLIVLAEDERVKANINMEMQHRCRSFAQWLRSRGLDPRPGFYRVTRAANVILDSPTLNCDERRELSLVLWLAHHILPKQELVSSSKGPT